MGSQPIGEIPVIISGDYSQLQDDLAQSIIAAELGAQKIASAFNTAATSNDQYTDSIQQSRAATLDEVTALGQAADAAAGYGKSIENVLGTERDYLDVLQELPKSYTEMSDAQQRRVDALNEEVNAQKAATDATGQAGNSLGGYINSAGGASDATKTFNLNVGDLLKSMAAFAGIQLSLQGIKAAIEESLTAFAQLQRATESLTALSGSAKIAEDSIAQLRQLAQDEALSFPSLLKADQQMTAFGLSTRQAIPLLAAAGDASRATGKDFDTVVNSLERIVESGAASGRTLVNLGLTSKDLASAMGVTTDQATKLFKALDESTRVEVITAALGKFGGLAKDTANDLTGAWQQISNTAQQEFARVGKELSELGPAFAAFSTGAIHALGSVADFFVNFVNTIVQKGGDLSNYLKNQAASWGISLDDYGKHAKDAADSNDRYEKSIGTLIISARQLFSQFPEYTSKLNNWVQELQHGEIDGATLTSRIQGLEEQFKSLNPEVDKSTAASQSFTDQVKALQQQLKDGEISASSYNQKIHELIQSHADATIKFGNASAAAKELKQSYENMGKAAKDADGSTATLLGYLGQLEGQARTLIGTFAQMGDAFQTFVHQSVDAANGYNETARSIVKEQNDLEGKANALAVAWNGLVDQYNKGQVGQEMLVRALPKLQQALDAAGISVADLDVKLKTVGDTIPVVSGGVTKLQTTGADASTAIDGLNKELQNLGVNSGVFDVHKAKVDATRDAYGMLKTAADSAFQSIVSGTNSSVQALTYLDAKGVEVGADLGHAMDPGIAAMLNFIKVTQQAQAAFGDLESSVLSFSSQLSVGSTGDNTAGGSTGKKKGGGSFNLANPYWDLDSPEAMQQAYNDLQSSFGGSAFNDFSGASFLLENQRILLNAALQNYYRTHPGNQSGGGSSSSGGGASAPSAPSAPAASPLKALAATSDAGSSIDGLTQGLATLTTTLTQSTDTIATSFASLTPVVQTATQEMSDAVQKQAASFQALSSTLAPLTAPAPVSAGTPASFMVTGSTSSGGSNAFGTTQVNNVTVQSPIIDNLMNQIMIELQRRGIRM